MAPKKAPVTKEDTDISVDSNDIDKASKTVKKNIPITKKKNLLVMQFQKNYHLKILKNLLVMQFQKNYNLKILKNLKRLYL